MMMQASILIMLCASVDDLEQPCEGLDASCAIPLS